MQKILNKLTRLISLVVVVVLVVAIALASPLITNNGPVTYTNIVEHFKYGSIGSEPANGIPYWIWKVMPVMFSDLLPGEGYGSLGFLYETDHEFPVGFSQRKTMINRVGLNCAVCHAGLVQETPKSLPQVIPAMASNTVNLQGYIRFISAVALDPRFTADEMMPQFEALGANFNPLEKLLYRFVVVPQTRDALISQGQKLSFLEQQPDWGPGRVDTFNPYKTLQFNYPMDQLPERELIGTADFPVIWQQKPREGLQLHWDGDNTSVDERNLSAALGAGVTPTTVDLDGIKRVADWLWELPPPAYPYPVDTELADQGAKVFENSCAICHSFGRDRVGKVTSIDEIGTDRHRLDSYTYDLLSNQNTLYAASKLRFNHFRKTNGYANLPLDGTWLRAPYLHNGSVPTLRDLLESPEQRPTMFYRGNPVYDPENVGFVSTVAEHDGQDYFKYDTALPGNSNAGHSYGVDLSNNEKTALIEYLKQH
ncbi:MAG: cytochrome c [Leptolyngbya sp. SIO3F4]|nr:cytochrome c [Leptolyngbya sp. SIO3F4]